MKTVFNKSEIPEEVIEEYQRIENELLAEEFHTKEKPSKKRSKK